MGQPLARRAAVAVAAFALVGVTAAPLAAAVPASPPAPTSPSTGATSVRPGGLLPDVVLPSTTCSNDGAGVCIVKAGTGRSCTGYSSQSVTPATIRVLVHTPQIAVVTVPFEQYVENVLPNEWIASWDSDALKAGAVAVKSYAWYWITHYGGYLNTSANCFDVTDDTYFQVYRANSASPRTTIAVQQAWPITARMGGRVIQASYRAYLHSSTEACGTYATGSTLSQWGTQNCVQGSTGYKYNVILAKYYFPGLQLTTAAQLRTIDDFTFEHASTRAVFTPSTGMWALDDGYGTTVRFGLSGDVPAVTNAGDGFAAVGVYRPSTGNWYRAGPTGAIASKIQWGVTGDLPVQAHFSGASRPTVLATFRPSTGIWYLRGVGTVAYGVAGDIPVPGHYAGGAADDYLDHPAVFRPSEGYWYLLGAGKVRWGIAGDIPVPGDYDGNGTTDVAVYRRSTHTWYVHGSPSVNWGLTGDIPVVGDFNGDGRTDVTMYRPSTNTWYVRGISTKTFGTSTGVPIGQAPARD